MSADVSCAAALTHVFPFRTVALASPGRTSPLPRRVASKGTKDLLSYLIVIVCAARHRVGSDDL